MKEVEKKDAPDVSGGATAPSVGWLPIAPYPTPQPIPSNPGAMTDPPDPLGDAIRKNQVQS